MNSGRVCRYNGLRLPLLSIDERLDVLLHVKWTVKEFDCNLTREATCGSSAGHLRALEAHLTSASIQRHATICLRAKG